MNELNSLKENKGIEEKEENKPSTQYIERLSELLKAYSLDELAEFTKRGIRLDCIEGNDIPQKMYMSFGFKYVDKVGITYVDIGVPRKFLLYEFVL